ncbi:unnamed protein product [Pleuronectes platessa]|uniref:Uncharacterized protein n=1 Tax=Pleuronectes platessa TaxID=8262 RepID=A0A9N7YIG2_PLEPL|nr:unnamed protein product [Pleuronectes platessa]
MFAFMPETEEQAADSETTLSVHVLEEIHIPRDPLPVEPRNHTVSGASRYQCGCQSLADIITVCTQKLVWTSVEQSAICGGFMYHCQVGDGVLRALLCLLCCVYQCARCRNVCSPTSDVTGGAERGNPNHATHLTSYRWRLTLDNDGKRVERVVLGEFQPSLRQPLNSGPAKKHLRGTAERLNPPPDPLDERGGSRNQQDGGGYECREVEARSPVGTSRLKEAQRLMITFRDEEGGGMMDGSCGRTPRQRHRLCLLVDTGRTRAASSSSPTRPHMAVIQPVPSCAGGAGQCGEFMEDVVEEEEGQGGLDPHMSVENSWVLIEGRPSEVLDPAAGAAGIRPW